MPREPPWSGTTTTAGTAVRGRRCDVRQDGLGQALGDEHDRVFARGDQRAEPLRAPPRRWRRGIPPRRRPRTRPSTRRPRSSRSYTRPSSILFRISASGEAVEARTPARGAGSRGPRACARSTSTRTRPTAAESASCFRRALSARRRAAASSATSPPAAAAARSSRTTGLATPASRPGHSAGLRPESSSKRASSAWPAKAYRATVHGMPASAARTNATAADEVRRLRAHGRRGRGRPAGRSPAARARAERSSASSNAWALVPASMRAASAVPRASANGSGKRVVAARLGHGGEVAEPQRALGARQPLVAPAGELLQHRHLQVEPVQRSDQQRLEIGARRVLHEQVAERRDLGPGSLLEPVVAR